MSPFKMDVLMHYYCMAVPHPKVMSKGVQEYIHDLVEDGVMIMDEESGTGFRMTEKGYAWIQMILDTPMPISVWTDPRQTKQATR